MTIKSRKKTAEKAVKESLEKGNEPIVTTDEEGQEFHQRPFDIKDIPEQKLAEGKRVNVISIHGSKMFLTDCCIMPHEEKEILLSDYERFGKGKLKRLA